MVDKSNLRVQADVRYVICTPTRFGRFKKCIDHETIAYKGYVGNDCETRWNSTYKMLNVSLMHKMTFMKLEFNDQQYVDELTRGKWVPTSEDWEHVELILSFLSIFHESTMRMSGSSYLTSNLCMFEVFSITRLIINMCYSEDEKLKSMVVKMKMKFDKYCGNPDRLNILLLIAMVLDIQCRMKFVVWLRCTHFIKLVSLTSFPKLNHISFSSQRIIFRPSCTSVLLYESFACINS
jgi:hypothetical protein